MSMHTLVIATFVLVVGIIAYLAFIYRSISAIAALTSSFRKSSEKTTMLAELLSEGHELTRSITASAFYIYLLKNGWGIHRIGTLEPFEGHPWSIADDFLADVPPRTPVPFELPKDLAP